MPTRTSSAAPAPAPRAPLDLSGLRGFVTLISLVDLANHTEAAGAYFRAFGAEDDATLLVHAPSTDVNWATWLVCRAIEAGGAQPDDCADVKLCVVDDDPATVDRFSRLAHAVLTVGDGSWLPWRRPVYGFSEVAPLRRQAERFWGSAGPKGAPYSYEAAIAYTVDRGWTNEFHARSGAVPEPSLKHVVVALDRLLPVGPVRILHVGNFLGISLSYVLNWATARQGLVVSVDADVPHRGVMHPQRACNDLLAHFGLTRGHMQICGYSLEKCVSNDSVVYEDYNPAAAWIQEAAPEYVLPTLAATGHRFDAAFIDGNHEPGYLRREIAEIAQILPAGGLLILDDVDGVWEHILGVFNEVTAGGEWPFERVDADGRIGILRRL